MRAGIEYLAASRFKANLLQKGAVTPEKSHNVHEEEVQWRVHQSVTSDQTENFGNLSLLKYCSKIPSSHV